MRSPRFVVLAVLALACCVAPAFSADTMSDDKKMSGDKKVKEMKGGDVASTLEANERAINEAFKNKDVAAFMNVVDKNAWGVDGMGVHPVSEIADMMKDIEIKSYSVEGFKTSMLTKDLYVITYTAHWDGTYRGQPMPPAPTLVSTVYAKKGGKWVGVFHQESMGMPTQAMGSQN